MKTTTMNVMVEMIMAMTKIPMKMKMMMVMMAMTTDDPERRNCDLIIHKNTKEVKIRTLLCSDLLS